MIPLEQNVECYSGKSLKSTGFTMSASAKSFKILADGLYSNKIRAVIREYMTNAFDAHRGCNKESTPFRVHLPTQLQPWFEVEDFGVGFIM